MPSYVPLVCALYQSIFFLFLPNGRYAGERDKFGRIHGRGTVYFPNGRKFVGNFSHGARCGGGELFEREGARILSGTYVHDRLSGHCEISTNEGGAMEYTFARGVASGPVRRFSPTGFLQGRLYKINQNVPVNSSTLWSRISQLTSAKARDNFSKLTSPAHFWNK